MIWLGQPFLIYLRFPERRKLENKIYDFVYT
jgi:hypothetical protein